MALGGPKGSKVESHVLWKPGVVGPEKLRGLGVREI